MLPLTEVDAQSTADDSISRESSSLNEAVNLIREVLKDMKKACALKEQQVLPMATTGGTLQLDAVNGGCQCIV